MVLAYVLIALKGSSNASRVAKDLLAFDEIKTLHLLYGEWDIIAEVAAENMIALREFTLEKLLKMPNIGRTNTLIVADSED